MIERLKKLQNKPLSLYHDGVIKDLTKALQKWGRLTHGQEAFFLKIESQYTDEAIALREEALRKLKTCEQYRKDVKVVAEYYQSTGYYRNVCRKVLQFLRTGDVGDAPDPKALSKMMTNKYAQNILDSVKGEPKFSVGDLVQLRANPVWDNIKINRGTNKWGITNFDAFMVVEVDSSPLSRSLTYHPTTGGTRWYKVLPLGSTDTFEVIEKSLKRTTKKAMGKK